MVELSMGWIYIVNRGLYGGSEIDRGRKLLLQICKSVPTQEERGLKGHTLRSSFDARNL